jgi:AcrR family transcriptional regulator
MKTRSPRKPKGQGAERREEILDAAQTLFGQKGVHAVSTRQIAELAGISQPALYAYFATKDDIAAELCVRAFAILGQRMAAARVDYTPTPENFERCLRVYIDFGLDHPDAYRVAFMLEKSVDGAFLEKTGGRPMLAGKQVFHVFVEMVGEPARPRPDGRRRRHGRDSSALGGPPWPGLAADRPTGVPVGRARGPDRDARGHAAPGSAQVRGALK